MLTLKIINYHTHTIQEKVLGCLGAPEQYLIGRAPSCDLLLDSPEVSRVHARIVRRQGEYFFTDLGSTDGSRLNQEHLLPSQETRLQPDDLLRIGEFVLVVQSIQREAARSHPPATDLWNPAVPISVRCVQIIAETPDVKTFRFATDPPLRFDYQPGQFVMLHLPIDGKTILRSYSISSTPSRPHLLEITVKRVPAPASQPDLPPGLVSNWLHDHLTVGMVLQLQGPLGQFTCGKEPPPKLLLISAGSGITPMMAMTRWIADTAAGTDIVFAYTARSPRDLVFVQELALLDQQYSNLKLALTTTREQLGQRDQPGQTWWGYRGRMDAGMLRAIAPDFCDREVFVCGPNPFMAAIKALLEDLGLPMAQYHEESFGASKPITTPSAKSSTKSSMIEVPDIVLDKASDQAPDVNQSQAQPPLLVFSQSEQEVVCEDDASILDLAESAGVTMTSACRMGACGACKQKLCSGEVTYIAEPSALGQHEQDEFILPCVARPVGRVVIEA